MLQAIVLGAAQGLTEFVPVSSSAHLVLLPFLLRWRIPSLAFDVAIHLGTLVALLVYFAPDLLRMLAGATRAAVGRGNEGDRLQRRLALLLAAAALIGSAEAVNRRRPPERRRDMAGVGWRDAVVIGLFQALAIAPGISRSGATISAGLYSGLTREAAARFSFLLSIPAILGAALVAVPDVPPGTDWGPTIAGAAVAAVFGFAAIAFLLRYLRTRTMLPFAAYCVALAVVALAVVAVR